MLALTALGLGQVPGAVFPAREIEAAVAARVERSVPVSRAVPVHVLYQTAWVDGRGGAQFREDVYGHDRRLGNLLRGLETSTTMDPETMACSADET